MIDFTYILVQDVVLDSGLQFAMVRMTGFNPVTVALCFGPDDSKFSRTVSFRFFVGNSDWP
jgi:hypothetical protein